MHLSAQHYAEAVELVMVDQDTNPVLMCVFDLLSYLYLYIFQGIKPLLFFCFKLASCSFPFNTNLILIFQFILPAPLGCIRKHFYWRWLRYCNLLSYAGYCVLYQFHIESTQIVLEEHVFMIVTIFHCGRMVTRLP